MQISSPLPNAQRYSGQMSSARNGAPNFGGNDAKTDKGKAEVSANNAQTATEVAIPWMDKIFTSPFFLGSQGGVPALQGLIKALTQESHQPRGNEDTEHRQALLNAFHKLLNDVSVLTLKAQKPILQEQESFPLFDPLLSGSPKEKQLAEKLGKAFKVKLPNAQTLEGAQARLDQFTQILPRQTRGLLSHEPLPIQDLLAGGEPAQTMDKPPGFDPLTPKEQQALAELIETTPGLERNRTLRAMRHLTLSSTSYTDGYTPLHVAVEYEYLPVVKALLKMPDVDINAKTEEPHGVSILMEAVRTQNIEILKALLARPDIDLKDRSDDSGDNALELAQHLGNPDIIKLLENHIKKLNITLPPRSESQPSWEDSLLQHIQANQDRDPEQGSAGASSSHG